jgi:hypothetical protein
MNTPTCKNDNTNKQRADARLCGYTAAALQNTSSTAAATMCSLLLLLTEKTSSADGKWATTSISFPD